VKLHGSRSSHNDESIKLLHNDESTKLLHKSHSLLQKEFHSDTSSATFREAAIEDFVVSEMQNIDTRHKKISVDILDDIKTCLSTITLGLRHLTAILTNITESSDCFVKHTSKVNSAPSPDKHRLSVK